MSRVTDKNSMKKLFLALFSVVPLICFGQVVGNHGGGVDILLNNGSSAIGQEQWLCLIKSTKTKKLESDFLKLWNRKYETEQDTFNLIDSILLGVTFKEFGHFIPTVRSPVFICELPSQSDNFDVQNRADHEKELMLLKDILLSWEQGKEGIKENNICDKNFSSRNKRLEDLKKVIELYERKP